MVLKKNILIPGSEGKPVSLDIFGLNDRAPVVIYAHGFNGFKDWGNFDLVATQFASAGFTMVKFNFSHNGTTPDNPEDFTDLEAFGHNNYSKQLYDLDQVINWCTLPGNAFSKSIDPERLYLVGHSMGGGIALLKASQDPRIKKLVTWAGIAECKTPWTSWSSEQLSTWKKSGVAYYFNGRTGQQMPLYYQLYLDFQNHSEELDIPKAASHLQIPWLICHGKNDIAVPLESAIYLHHLQPSSEIFVVNGDHVFGRKHPWSEATLPDPMHSVVAHTIDFLTNL